MKQNKRTYIVAEAGVNHNGELAKALQLVDIAAEAGADAVKFQTFRAERLVSRGAGLAEYQQRALGDAADGQWAMLERLELSESDHVAIRNRCRERGVDFVSTAFDVESLAFLLELGVPWLKIGSGELTNGPLLLAHARTDRDLVLSTGMANLGEVEMALAALAFGMTRDGEPDSGRSLRDVLVEPGSWEALRERVTLLHCTSQYPAPLEDVNLRALDSLRAAFGLPVGYSDHTRGDVVSCAAVALGARMIEKHFTLDRDLPGPDHRASLEPDELAAMIRGIRSVECSLGDGIKQPRSSESSTREVARQVIVASRTIRRGDRIQLDDLATRRAGEGFSPMHIWDLAGRVASRDYEVGEVVQL